MNSLLSPISCAVPKELVGEFQLAAILTTTKIAQCMQLGSHGTTFGGILACAVAEQVMTILSKKTLLNGVKKKKKSLKELKSINKDYKCFSAIRSSGLWIGCKLNVKENFV